MPAPVSKGHFPGVWTPSQQGVYTKASGSLAVIVVPPIGGL